MQTFIALFRGINVGGKNKLKMSALKDSLLSLQLCDIETYIQSGNVVFRTTRKSTSRIARDIEDRVEQDHGFRPRVQVFDVETYESILTANPFPDAVDEPKTLHVAFLESIVDRSVTPQLEKIKATDEAFVLADQALYLHAPNGIARSKLAARAESILGVAATARNWRTATKLLDLALQLRNGR